MKKKSKAVGAKPFAVTLNESQQLDLARIQGGAYPPLNAADAIRLALFTMAEHMRREKR